MKNDKNSFIQILAILGALIWGATVILRGTSIINNQTVKFVLVLTS